MNIKISEYDEPERFKSRHIVQTRTGNSEVFTCTGVVETNMYGPVNGILTLIFRFDDILPKGKGLQVEQFAPFITINGMSTSELTHPNEEHKTVSGVTLGELSKTWIVDEFEGPGSVLISKSYTLTAKVFVSPHEFLSRVAYNVIFKGLLVDHEPETPK